MPAWNPQANDIFLNALEIAAPADRRAFIERACAGDAELHGQVVSLLEASQKAGSFLETPPSAVAVQIAATLDQPITEAPGTIIGRYKLKEQIGEGGMGVVYVAEQTEPVRRKVALKIIKPGMDTRQVIARFEAERQALALMDHPNIARVFDAGTTGRPYFVMELVRGMPITDYCDQVQLGTDGRLKLFSKVCQAVQHAHQKGIIHRDIKPSNVMVTLHDGVPVPKVIDFGVAKAINQRLTEESIYTHLTEMIGTPLYMSPEQAELSDLDVDTRSDVYSLGVLLYELLTGTTPFDKAALRKAGFDEIRRIIREQEPPKPSDRLGTIEAASRSTISEQRGIDPRKLTHTLRGDLDWIVMKALEKDRTRRYESASALATDVSRHLANEPIEAKRPTLVDRIAKWSRRHRTVVFSTAVILVMAVVGLTVSTVLIAHQRAETVKVLGQLQVKHQEVEQQRGRAEKAAQRAHLLATSAQQWSYASDIKLASAAWKDNDTQQLLALLDRHRPSPGQPDYRSFEWYFLRQQGSPQHGDLVTQEPNRIWCVQQSVDGRWIAAAGDDGVIKVYDARTREPRATFLSGQARVKSVAFGLDGNTLASADDEGTVRVWDIQKQRSSWSISAHEGSALGVAFCPSGKLLASCGSDAIVRFWDPSTGHPLGTFEGHKGAVEAIAISPDGRLLASVGRHYRLALWDLQTRQSLYMAERHSGRVTSVAFSPDGETLVTADVDGMICVWDVPHGNRVLVKNHLDGVESVAFSPSGKWFAAADRGGNIKCWNLDGQPQRWQFGHEHHVRWCAPSPDGRTVVAVTWQRVLLRDVSTGVVRELKVADQNILQNDVGDGAWPRRTYYHPFAFSRDGQWFVCVTEIYRADTNSPGGWKLQAKLPEDFRRFCSATFSPDAQSLVTGMSDGRICLWDVQTGTLQSTLQGHEAKPVRAVDYSPDGQTLVSCGDDCRIILWDVATQTEWKTLTGHEDCVNCVAFSPDGDELASCGLDRVIRLWDPRTGRMTGELQAHTDRTSAVAYSPDGRILASVESDCTVRLWDPAKRRLVRKLSANAWYLSFATAGKHRLVAGGLGRDVRWWNLDDVLAASEGPVASWHAHDGRAYSVAFSPTGDRLLSGGADGNVLSWKQFQPAPAKTLNHAGEDINDFAYVPGGRDLVTVGNDGAFLWNLQTGLAGIELGTENRSDSLVACSPDGKLLAVEDRERAIRLWDLERRAARTDWNPDQGSLDLLAFSPDGSMLACFSLEDDMVRLLDVPTGNTSWTFPGSPLIAVAFSPDSRILAVSDSRSRDAIHIWDLVGQNKMRTLLGHSNTVENLAFSPDGQLLASVSDDRLVKLWDWQAGTEQFSLSGHRGPVETLAFSPDGATLATAGEDGTLKLWQVASGRPLCDLAAMEGAIWKVAFNESGDSLACLMRLSKQIRFFEAPRGAAATPSPAAESRDPQPVAAETLENVEARARQKERIEGIARRFTLPGKEMELSGTTMDGGPLEWSAYRGRVVLVAFWTTADALIDTAGFHAQIPDGRLNYELYHDRGFDILGISLDDDRRALQQYLRREPLPWVTVHDLDASGRHPLATYHGVIGTPRTFLVDRDGKVVSISARGGDLDKLLEELLGPPCVPTGELTHIDLQSHANWNLKDSADNSLNELPQGEQVFGGVRFFIGEKAIELANKRSRSLPERVEGIPVNSKVGKLYVLHGSQYGEVPGREVVDGDRIGRYQVHYEDDTSETIPVVYGEDIRDWHDLYRKAVTRGKVVWTGSNPRAQRRGARLRLYLTRWENPHPDKKVSHLDYISTNTTFATPFCVAITVESPATPTTDN